MKNDMHNIYDLIEKIKRRPAMFLVNKSIQELETYLNGYLTALSAHQIEEEVPSLAYYFDWMKFEHNIFNSKGWSYALLEKAGDNDKAMNLFFTLVEDFSKLVPRDKGVLKISNTQTRSKQFLETNPGWSQEPLPSHIKLYNLSPGDYWYLTYYCDARPVLNRELYRSKSDALKHIRWEFDIAFEG